MKGSWFTSFNGPWKLVQYIEGFTTTAHFACELRLKAESKMAKYHGTTGRIRLLHDILLN